MTITPQPAPVGQHAAPGTGDDADPTTDRLVVPEQYQRPAAGPVPEFRLPAAPPPDVRVPGPYAPTGRAIKRRNPVGVWLGLPLITLGVYTFVWYFLIHREMAELDRRRARPVAGPVLVLLFLGWTVVAPLVSLFQTGRRIADAQRAAGLRPSCSAGIGLLLCFVLGLVSLYYQAELNKVADAYGVPAGTEIALRG